MVHAKLYKNKFLCLKITGTMFVCMRKGVFKVPKTSQSSFTVYVKVRACVHVCMPVSMLSKQFRPCGHSGHVPGNAGLPRIFFYPDIHKNYPIWTFVH